MNVGPVCSVPVQSVMEKLNEIFEIVQEGSPTLTKCKPIMYILESIAVLVFKKHYSCIPLSAYLDAPSNV